MNIAFDMFYTKSDSLHRGIGRYSNNLIQHIVLSDTHNEHAFFYFYPEVSRGEAHVKQQLEQFIAHNSIDVFHILSPFEHYFLKPFTNFHVLRKEWYAPAKVAVTLYDLIPLVYEQHYLQDTEIRQTYDQIVAFIRSCDIVFSISETTKSDALRLCGLDPKRIKVISAGVDEQFTVRPIERDALADKYGIDQPYILCAGKTDFLKNAEKLVEAFIIANEELRNTHQLVIAGSISEHDKGRLIEIAGKSGDQDQLVLTGFVPDEDLVNLYNGAEIFAFPSLYEGFGFPVVEAMACGAPILISGISSLAEIAGSAAYVIDPNSSVEIAEGIKMLLLHPGFRAEMKTRGFNQAAKYQWNSVAERALQGYTQINRKKIAVFAPLPPLVNDIATYMANLLPAHSAAFDVDVYVDSGYKPDEPEADGVRVLASELFSEHEDEYKAVFYQLGNSKYHAYMVPHLRKYPGIIVLHDLNLQVLIDTGTNENNDMDGSYNALEETYVDHAERVTEELLSSNKTSPHNRKPPIDYFIQNASAVIVHNDFAKRALESKGYDNVTLARLPAKWREPSRKLDSSEVVFGSFGILHPIKQLEPVMLSIRKLLDNGIANVRYIVVGTGQEEYAASLIALVEELQLQRHVQLTGIVEDAEYERLICATDVGINLGTPGHGESAASLLDLLSCGVPTVVSDVDGFSELPEDIVWKVPINEQLAENLYQAMSKLYADIELRNAMSEHAIRYVRANHDLSAYADQLHVLAATTMRIRTAPTEIALTQHEEEKLQTETRERPIEMLNNELWKEVERSLAQLASNQARIIAESESIQAAEAPASEEQQLSILAVDPASEEEALAQAVDPAAEEEALAQAVDPTAEEEALAQAVDPAAEEEVSAQAIDPVSKEEASAQAIDPASVEEASPQAIDPASEEEVSAQAIDPAPEEEASAQAIDPASEEEASAQAIDPASEEEESTQVIDPAAEEEASAQEVDPASEELSAQAFNSLTENWQTAQVVESDAISFSEEPQAITGAEVIRLLPNRFLTRKKGEKFNAFFSFNLAELPPDTGIEHAVMHIPILKNTSKVKVHRINRSWSEASANQKMPKIRKIPVYSVDSPKSKTVRWDCTRLARKWANDQLSNHGIYAPSISRKSMPELYVRISRMN